MSCVRRRWWRRWAAGALLAALLACGVVLLRVRVSVSERVVLRVARASPAAVAHALADYSARDHEGPWSVEEESGNYTAWRYTVRYVCGERCEGEARVLATDELRVPHVPHEPPRGHTVRVQHVTCTRPPLLPWPRLCEERETESRVSGDGADGALLQDVVRARCGALRAVSGACGAGEGLRAHRDRELRRALRHLLPAEERR